MRRIDITQAMDDELISESGELIEVFVVEIFVSRCFKKRRNALDD